VLVVGTSAGGVEALLFLAKRFRPTFIVDGGRLSLGSGPRENNARPAIDPIRRSAALCCGFRSVGVVLTGTMGDGASGLLALRQCGGTTVVQDPHARVCDGMSASSCNTGADGNVGHVFLLSALGVARLSAAPRTIRAPDARSCRCGRIG
jgi:chemotaxis response regulator CheB